MMIWKDFVLGVAHHFGYHITGWPIQVARPDFKMTLRDFIVAHDVGCVFDVGANAGQYATMLRGMGYLGRIVSFEPDPASFARLRARAAGDAAWRVVPLALGSREEERPLHVMHASDMSSFKMPNAYGLRLYPELLRIREQPIVQVCRLADVIDEFSAELPAGTGLLLKMDTQGFDHEVLDGARPVLDKFVGVQTEAALLPIYQGVPRFSDTVRFFEDACLELVAAAPVNRRMFSIIELDCLWQRTGAGERLAPRANEIAPRLLDAENAGVLSKLAQPGPCPRA